ncbi:MAG: FAD:protein FMN transferase [Firmicutes bacterium]|nr:FAD:protein FMN transferase [Bacillota bacterium]
MFLAKKSARKLIITLIFFLFFAGILSGCGKISNIENENVSKSTFLLNTYITVTLYNGSEALAQQCIEECKRYEKIFSRTDDNSELYLLNACDSMEVSPELLEVITEALSYCKLTDGAFDITLGGVSDLYAFSSEEPQVPSEIELAEAMSHIGYEKILIEGNTVTILDPETVLDLGAIAKGYIADRLAEFLISNGAESALIDLGGNIMCVGSKPDGSSFKIGLQYPFKDSSELIGTVKVSDRSVVTSGIYERCFESDGVFYHHILDPKTGRPYDNGLLSVSIISESSMHADALSTACFSLGLEKGLKLINSLPHAEAVFVDKDYGLHYSNGISKYLE